MDDYGSIIDLLKEVLSQLDASLTDVIEAVENFVNSSDFYVDMGSLKDIPIGLPNTNPYTANFKRGILFKSKVFISRDVFIPSMKKYRHNIRSVI